MTTDSVEYHPLRVAGIETLTAESVAITFDVPTRLAETFRFLPGQHVALKAVIDGQDVRRTYSVCADPADDLLRVGVRRIPGGRFSTFATEHLEPGDQLEVSAPYGEFTIDLDPQAARRYGAIAAGSGITPILAMIAAVLSAEPQSSFTLVFGNRSSASIMFLEELEGLKDRYPDRFQLIHVLSREAQIIPMLSGRLDEARLATILESLVDPDIVDAWYLCGPYEVVAAAQAALVASGVDPAAIHDELFFAQPTPPTQPPAVADTGGVVVEFTLDGRTSSVMVDPSGPPVLAYALEERRDTPFSCRGGMCTTCKAQVTEGSATMDLNFALTAEDLARGYILTCQAHPASDRLTITYDV
ncbi:MAG: phenylacetate-CoA oxygenase/reductase subunit PaaK [Acidimicrobiia bacterium]|nr:phenylacetate-CoA oxygenase/reductase subunit PaaK [Acidimicrobiia bacterium]